MKAHARVIWACSWAPGDRMFATGARDSTVKVWQLGQPGQGRHSPWLMLLPCRSNKSPQCRHWRSTMCTYMSLGMGLREAPAPCLPCDSACECTQSKPDTSLV